MNFPTKEKPGTGISASRYNEKSNIFDTNKLGETKHFRDRKDVEGELILDENAFFGEFLNEDEENSLH